MLGRERLHFENFGGDFAADQADRSNVVCESALGRADEWRTKDADSLPSETGNFEKKKKRTSKWRPGDATGSNQMLEHRKRREHRKVHRRVPD